MARILDKQEMDSKVGKAYEQELKDNLD
ncbi:MAG: hypothetical protein QG552_3116, partial [Thermodesulfobacteriota bacterium]|nr:hypothetical protein [Thermodesulfobacteriota bacterium]